MNRAFNAIPSGTHFVFKATFDGLIGVVSLSVADGEVKLSGELIIPELHNMEVFVNISIPKTSGGRELSIAGAVKGSYPIVVMGKPIELTGDLSVEGTILDYTLQLAEVTGDLDLSNVTLNVDVKYCPTCPVDQELSGTATIADTSRQAWPFHIKSASGLPLRVWSDPNPKLSNPSP